MTERKIIEVVRAACVLRDGYCRLRRLLGAGKCDGPSEWAHFGPWKRWKTMGLPPEERHCTRGSMMLCRLHHVLYDGKYVRLSGAVGELEIVTTDERQADGPVVFILNGVRYEEAA